MFEPEAQWQSIFMVLALLMSRMLVTFSIIPLFASGGIPAGVRTVFVAGLAFSLLPLAYADEALVSLPLASVPLYLAKEAAIGLALGLLASIGFWALYAAGAMIDYQSGLAFASTIDPLTGQEESLLGTFLMRLFTVLFLITGGLLSLIGLLFESYVLWPVSSMLPTVASPLLVELMLRALADLLAIALKVAAPFLIMMLLIELAVGLLSRFAPLLNVFFVVLPLKALALALMLLLYGMVIASGAAPLPLADFSDSLRLLREAWR